MGLADYNIKFIHIKGKINVLADTFSRLKTSKYFQRTVGEPKNTSS